MSLAPHLAPDLAALIDPEIARDRLEALGLDLAGVQADYIRHKPSETTIVGYTLLTPAGELERGYICRCDRPDRADAMWAKAVTLKSRVTPLGTAIARLDRHTIFYPFPCDARLRSARWYVTPRKLKRTGLTALAPSGSPVSGTRSTVQVLRYKPERRLVVAVELVTAHEASRTLLVRYSTSSTAQSLAATATALRNAGISTPKPLLQLEDGTVSVDEFIDGIELRSAVRAGRASHTDLPLALTRFHGASIEAPQRSAWDELVAAAAGLDGLASLVPSIERLCTVLRRDLARTLPAPDAGPDVLLHGDLHDENVMITRDGVSFVDLERAARGPAAIDLGRLRGATQAMTVRRPSWSPQAAAFGESVIESYLSSGPKSTTPQISEYALAWHTAIAFVDQALLATRQLEVGWRNSAEALIELASRQTAIARRIRQRMRVGA